MFKINVGKGFYFLTPFQFWIHMRFTFERNVHWMLVFAVKILGCIIILNSVILPILWILKVLHLCTLILAYEALFILIIGVFQILGSFIYRENSLPYSWGFRTGWWDFKKFAKLTPEERDRYRKEGIIITVIGFILGLTAIVIHFFIFIH